MNLARISNESRHDDEQSARAALPECECLADASLCEDCRQKLARYDLLLSFHRHLSHEVAGVLACHGNQMPPKARGRLRAAFVEDSIPYLGDFGDRFWERLAGIIVEKEGLETP